MERARFWDKLVLQNDCWVYTGSLSGGGYARVSYLGKPNYLHRLMYEYLVVEIPDGLVLDHLCRNRACVNPHHLEPVSQQENVRRGNTGLHQTAKTHCKYGHEYTKDNTLVYSGRRHCRACKHWRDTHRKQPACEQPLNVV